MQVMIFWGPYLKEVTLVEWDFRSMTAVITHDKLPKYIPSMKMDAWHIYTLDYDLMREYNRLTAQIGDLYKKKGDIFSQVKLHRETTLEEEKQFQKELEQHRRDMLELEQYS